MNLHTDFSFIAGRVVTASQTPQSGFIINTACKQKIRFTNAWIDPSDRKIYAGDDKGLIHLFDPHLCHLSTSPPTLHGTTVFGITGTAEDIFTRDTAGNLIRWNKSDFVPSEFISTQHFAAETNPPAPSPSNAIEVVNDELWVSNARGSISVFKIGLSLLYSHEMHASPTAFPERLVHMPDGTVFMADVAGNLWRAGPGMGDFMPFFSVGAGVVHSIALDARTGHYWLTSDICGSVVIVDSAGQLRHQLRITGDDVEEIVIDQQKRRCYVACFDHFIHVLDIPEYSAEDNGQGDVPKEIGLIGPFKFQLSHLKSCGENLLVILESGEMFLVDSETYAVIGAAGGTDCVWNVEVDDCSILCPTESGRLLELPYQISPSGILEFGQGKLSPEFSFGRIRKAVRLEDGSMIVATTAGCVCRLQMDGAVHWQREMGGIIRDISLSPSGCKVVCATETGMLAEIDLPTGEITALMVNDRPIWCVLHRSEREVLFGERRMVDDITKLKDDLSRLASHDFETDTTRTLLSARGNFKRLMFHDTNTLLIASNTEHYVFLFDIISENIVRSYKDWIINTPENACIVGEKLFAVTYSQQVLQYDLNSSEVESVEFSAEGYPKVIRRIGVDDPSLLITGRGFVSQYAIGSEGPELVRTWFLDALIKNAAVQEPKLQEAFAQ